MYRQLGTTYLAQMRKDNKAFAEYNDFQFFVSIRTKARQMFK